MVFTAYKVLLTIFDQNFKKTISYKGLEVIFSNNELVTNNMFKLNILNTSLSLSNDSFYANLQSLTNV